MTADHPSVEVPTDVLEFLGEHKTLTLATAAPTGVPRAATFLYVNDGPTIYFWTRSGTATARHIDQNRAVAFTIDEYTNDLNQTRGLQASGECGVLLSGEDIARVADLFGQKFPSLSPGNTLSISFYRIVLTELDFINNARSRGASSEGTFGADFHRERSYSVFSQLPAQTVDVITAALQPMTADAGEVIVRQGAPADKFFVVVEGEVEVVRDSDGGEEELARLGPGSFFGEVAIITGRSRTATVRATQPARLLSMDGDTFRAIVGQSLGTTADFDQLIQSRLSAGGG
jgi:uncharacterized protein YhbP (UPF0306 family)